MTTRLKEPVLRDREYLDWVREQRCLFTGLPGNDHMAVDPMHLGTLGKGIKSPDNEVLPIIHYLHARGHSAGEASMLRREAPNDVILAAFKALARQIYAKYRREQGETL